MLKKPLPPPHTYTPPPSGPPCLTPLPYSPAPSLRSASDEAVKEVLKKKLAFKQLDNQVARLAMKLPCGDVVKQGRKLDGLLGAGEDGESGGEGGEHDPDDIL